MDLFQLGLLIQKLYMDGQELFNIKETQAFVKGNIIIKEIIKNIQNEQI